MSFFKWFTGGRSVRDTVLSLYRRGLAKGKKRNQQGAIEDYTAAINTPDVPTDVKAMALYNRALLYASTKEISKAMNDLKAVVALDEPLMKIKTAAKQTLDRLHRQQGVDSDPRSESPVRK